MPLPWACPQKSLKAKACMTPQSTVFEVINAKTLQGLKNQGRGLTSYIPKDASRPWSNAHQLRQRPRTEMNQIYTDTLLLRRP